MKKGLRGKFQNKKGFTLVEMLIVVAIIAILIAVSIPLVQDSLEKARDATDQANERSAKAVAVLYYLGGATENTLDIDGTAYVPGSDIETGKVWYDAVNGKLVSGTKPAAYGKCQNKSGCYQNKGDHSKQIIEVSIDGGEVSVEWVDIS